MHWNKKLRALATRHVRKTKPRLFSNAFLFLRNTLGLAKTKEKEITRIIKEEDKELFCSLYRPLGLPA